LTATTRLLADRETLVRRAALESVTGFGGESKVFVPCIVNLVLDDDTGLSSLAERVLLVIGRDAVPSLISEMKTRNSADQVRVIRILGRMGRNARVACFELLRLLSRADETVREEAEMALSRILLSGDGRRG
jgi:HEAT repeat protein